MTTLDRYLVRQILPAFLLALAVFTFVLAIRPMLENAEQLLAKNVPVPTVAFLLVLLLPQALGLTLPMAFLAGVLMGLGRMSADRESVALLACGVSPVRLLRPVLAAALLVAGATLYVLVQAVPDANQRFREITYQLLAQRSQSDIKARIFYEGFPGLVLYVQDTRPDGGWTGVVLADTSQPGRPTVYLAAQGFLVLDEARRRVDILLRDVFRYGPGADPGVYDVGRHAEERMSVRPETVFGDGTLTRGLPEMRIADLRRQAAYKESIGESPHNEIMYLHQKFSFPVACLVFALLGLALGLHTRREGRLAGFALGLGVVVVYWALMNQAEAWTKGQLFPAAWARWVPNLVLGPVGVLAVWWRTRPPTRARLSMPLPFLIRRGPRGSTRSADRSPAPPALRRVVLVIRVPRLGWPRPRLLDLYVVGRYLRLIGLGFVGLMALYYIGTVVDLSEKLFKGQATGAMMAAYLWYSTPQFMYFVLPIATLVAVLGTIGGLTRTSELTVMRACGVSLYRAAAPLLVLALAGSAILIGIEERLLPPATRKAEVLEDAIRGRAPRTVHIANRNWLASDEGRLYYYAAYDAGRRTLLGLSVFDLAPGSDPYRLAGHAYATRAVYDGEQWQAENGWLQRFPGPARATREAFGRRVLDLPAPRSFGDAQVAADLMTFGELRAYIRRLGDSGFSVAEQRVNLHRKMAFPFVTVVMTLIAVPFAVTTGRRGALYGIGLAIALAVAYSLVSTFFLAMGAAALLPAPLAAWAGNVLFLAGAIYLTLAVRT